MIPSLPPPVHAASARHARSAGFTLIEVMVVVAILAILASVVVLQVMDRPGEARQAAARADIATIVSALNLYRLDNYAYPSTEQGLQALSSQPAGQPEARNWRAGGYLDRLPVDPWKREYLYLNPGQRAAVDVYTLGADGRPGGEGENADIGNWDD